MCSIAIFYIIYITVESGYEAHIVKKRTQLIRRMLSS